MNPNQQLSIAIIGCGPAGLFAYKNLIKTGRLNFTITIFEASGHPGSGMPYSTDGAGEEHITNVSGNEIPDLVIPITKWLTTLPPEKLKKFKIDPENFTAYNVFPRLLFGEYLNAQFALLQQQAAVAGIKTNIFLNCRVADVMNVPNKNKVKVELIDKKTLEFDHIIICTGHAWPLTHEGKVSGYFDSPYPPAKLAKRFNHSIALKGGALTAIDAIRTLASSNGKFIEDAPHALSFIPDEAAPDFKIVLYCLKGLLPAIRFHLDDTHLDPSSMLSKKEIQDHIADNNGFLSLDFIFEKDFKEILRKKDPSFYAHIKNRKMEEFVDEMMAIREQADPFSLFKAEYEEARLSIKRKKSVYWKEMLGALSFAMNYPAKHFSAEDMLRLQKTLMPLISIVIAYTPQSSCEELLALYEAGRLEIIPVSKESHVDVNPAGGVVYHHTDKAGQEHKKSYHTFIDCTGQRHLSPEAFPFKSLVRNGNLSSAHLKFRSPEHAAQLQLQGNGDIISDNKNDYYLKVPGITITDSFRMVDTNGISNPHIYVMAVPFIGGYNPDYSGLDFCEEASSIIVNDIFNVPVE